MTRDHFGSEIALSVACVDFESLTEDEMLRSLVRPSNYRLRHSFHSTAVAARPSFPDTSPKETKTKRTKVDSLEGLVAEIATANAPTRVVRKRIKKIEAPVLPGERLVLPEQDLWRGLFPPIKNKDRISLSNPATAAAIAEAYVPAGSRDQVIIEAFPGELKSPSDPISY